MRCPGIPLVVFLLSGATPAKATRTGVQDDQLRAEEGVVMFGGGWDDKIEKIRGYLLQGLKEKKLTGEFESLTAVAEELQKFGSPRIQGKVLKNSYMNPSSKDRDTIVKFATERERAEYEESLGSAPPKLAIFDFDHTLTTRFFNPPETTPADILPDSRVANLTEMIDYLTQKNIKVVVLTRNSGALVTDAMKQRLPGNVFKDVFRVVGQEACNSYDWCVYDNPGPSSKADAIKTLFLDFWGMEWSQVLFADDELQNCEDVKNKSQGEATVVRVCHTLASKDKCEGITDIDDIKAWADL